MMYPEEYSMHDEEGCCGCEDGSVFEGLMKDFRGELPSVEEYALYRSEKLTEEAKKP